MRLWACWVVLLLGWVLTSPVRAEGSSLLWKAPPGCPDAPAARAIIVQHGGAALNDPELRVIANMWRELGGYQLDLTIERAGRTTEQRYSALHCATFAELIGLQLALTAASHEVSPPVGRARSARHWGLRAFADGGGGPVPLWSAGPGVGARLAVGVLQLELVANYHLRRAVVEQTSSEVVTRFDAWTGQVRGCRTLRVARAALPLCAGVELGTLRGSAAGVAESRAAWRGWAALGVAPTLRFPAGSRLAGWLELGAWLALYRPTFAVRNLPTRYRSELVSFRGALGVELQFE